jgi:hypothetical protein
LDVVVVAMVDICQGSFDSTKKSTSHIRKCLMRLKRISRLGVELLLQQWLAFPASEGKFAYWHQQRKWWGRDSSNAISQWAINQPFVSLFSHLVYSINNNSICWVYFILIGNCVIKNRSVRGHFVNIIDIEFQLNFGRL